MAAGHEIQQLPLLRCGHVFHQKHQRLLDLLVAVLRLDAVKQPRIQKRQIVRHGVAPQHAEPLRSLVQIRCADALFPVLDGLLADAQFLGLSGVGTGQAPDPRKALVSVRFGLFVQHFYHLLIEIIGGVNHITKTVYQHKKGLSTAKGKKLG